SRLFQERSMFLTGVLVRHLPVLRSLFQTHQEIITLCCTGTPLEAIRISLSLTRQMADSNATKTPTGCNKITTRPLRDLMGRKTFGAVIQSRPTTILPGSSATQEPHGISLIRGLQPIM